MDLLSLSQPDAALVQHGLKALGFYAGTTKGIPAAKTIAAYAKYINGVDTVSNPIAASSLARELVAILSAEEGVREIPANSNRGKRVEEFQSATWLSGSGWAWCAAFICWGILQLDKKHGLPFKRPETAGAWDFERWAKEEGLNLFKPRKEIKAGDIVIFTFSHIGLAIEDEKNGYVKTVEGNTSTSGSREGGGVYIQNRKTSLVRAHIRIFP
jgi:hypothetical protein